MCNFWVKAEAKMAKPQAKLEQKCTITSPPGDLAANTTNLRLRNGGEQRYKIRSGLAPPKPTYTLISLNCSYKHIYSRHPHKHRGAPLYLIGSLRVTKRTNKMRLRFVALRQNGFGEVLTFRSVLPVLDIFFRSSLLLLGSEILLF